MNGTAPSSSLNNAHGDNTTSLGHLQESQTISVDCALLNYSIFTTDSLATFPSFEFHDFETAQLVLFISVHHYLSSQLHPESVTVLSF